MIIITEFVSCQILVLSFKLIYYQYFHHRNFHFISFLILFLILFSFCNNCCYIKIYYSFCYYSLFLIPYSLSIIHLLSSYLFHHINSLFSFLLFTHFHLLLIYFHIILIILHFSSLCYHFHD